MPRRRRRWYRRPRLHRQHAPVVSPLLHERARPWLPLVQASGLTACGVFPLFAGAGPVGVIYFFFGRANGQLDQEASKLMGRISENISFGLEVFARETERRLAEGQKEGLTRMYAALGAANEAIFRATTRRERSHLAR